MQVLATQVMVHQNTSFRQFIAKYYEGQTEYQSTGVADNLIQFINYYIRIVKYVKNPSGLQQSVITVFRVLNQLDCEEIKVYHVIELCLCEFNTLI